MNPRSRGAGFASESWASECQSRHRQNPTFVRPIRQWRAGWITVGRGNLSLRRAIATKQSGADSQTGLLRFTRKDEIKKEAERRETCLSNLRAPTFILPRVAPHRASAMDPVAGKDRGGGAAALQSGAPASRRSTAVLAKGTARRPRLSVRPCFLGLGRSVRSCTAAPTGGRRPCAAPRALPAPEKQEPVPVQRSTSRAGHSAGRMMPKPPGSQGDEPRPAGTALAPPTAVTRPASFTMSERPGLLVGAQRLSMPSRRRRLLFDSTALFAVRILDGKEARAGFARIKISWLRARRGVVDPPVMSALPSRATK